ncbi:hypothetical protein [Luteimonas panaciterrae]|uniref:hypothetical protein n=1 Tax=Luteimonas panaciterrae TaxID=363885 RepID=UPI001CF98C65|nr:hypothetical protein [Luteimonas panaciterrae]
MVVLFLGAMPAHAQQEAEAAQSQIGWVRYQCGPHAVELFFNKTDSEPAKAWETVEIIDAAGLVTYGEKDDKGDVRRTGSRELLRRCGPYTIRFRGGFYNANPQGELGAAEDYPLIEILEGERSIAGPIAMGSCNAMIGRESAMAECPRNWASRIQVLFPSKSQPALLSLDHEYQDSRSIPEKSDLIDK